jgi:hypothetical protein
METSVNQLGGVNMKFQIECNSLKKKQTCLVCKNPFEMKDARLILCSDAGDRYGDVCPDCMAKGADWIGSQYQERKLILSY